MDGYDDHFDDDEWPFADAVNQPLYEAALGAYVIAFNRLEMR